MLSVNITFVLVVYLHNFNLKVSKNRQRKLKATAEDAIKNAIIIKQ